MSDFSKKWLINWQCIGKSLEACMTIQEKIGRDLTICQQPGFGPSDPMARFAPVFCKHDLTVKKKKLDKGQNSV